MDFLATDFLAMEDDTSDWDWEGTLSTVHTVEATSDPSDPNFNQSQEDMWRYLRNMSYISDRLNQCTARGICACETSFAYTNRIPSRKRCRLIDRLLRENELARTPFLQWSSNDLKTSLKNLGAKLPKRHSQKALATALQTAESERCFPLLSSLPKELHLRIYELALQSDSHTQPLRHPKKPALLHTSHQIRDEATALFYRGNSFLLEYETDPYDLAFHFMTSSGTNPRDFAVRQTISTSSWLKQLDAFALQNLRHISFRAADWEFVDYIHIDLYASSGSSSAATQWKIQCLKLDSRCETSCSKFPKAVPLGLADDHFGGGEQGVLRKEVWIARADEAARRFREICVQGGVMGTRSEGLELLADVAVGVLRMCRFCTCYP